MEISYPARDEIKIEVCRMRQNVGDNELELALRAALANDNGDPQRLIAFILDALDAQRKKFTGNFTEASTSEWRKIYALADKDAERILLADSPQLAELTSLEQKAAAAKSAADKKAREMDSIWSEFQALPGKMERLSSRLARLQIERAELDEATLHKQFESHFREYLLTENVLRRTDSNHFAGLICRRNLRLAIVDAVELETRAEVAAIQKRNTELAKQLGISKHKF
jgi:hypothetical protein